MLGGDYPGWPEAVLFILIVALIIGTIVNVVLDIV